MQTADPTIQMVLKNIETVVASEGGSIELLEVGEDSLTIKYNKGVNEECPECVPDHNLVKLMLQTSVSNYAPHITRVEVV